MARWLFKEEPENYSFTNLEADGETTWEGVRNALALRHLRAVRPGDRVLFYHTGKEKAVVGEMEIVAEPQEQTGTVTVRVKSVRRLARAVPLSRIKEVEELADWDLVRLPRLSVLPVTEEQWRRIEELATEPSSETDGTESSRPSRKSGRRSAG